MIAANPASAKHVQTLLAKVNIRDDANDHQAYLELCDALRRAKQYGEAVSEYGRLQAVLARSPRSPLKNLVGIWPIYCRFKQSEDHMTNGAKYAAAAANPSLTPEQKAQYAAASRQLSGYANQFFNAAEQPLLKLADSPPKRQSNEYSLYKLLRAIHKDLNARRQEDLTRALQAAAQQAAAAGQEDDARARWLKLPPPPPKPQKAAANPCRKSPKVSSWLALAWTGCPNPSSWPEAPTPNSPPDKSPNMKNSPLPGAPTK